MISQPDESGAVTVDCAVLSAAAIAVALTIIVLMEESALTAIASIWTSSS